MIAARATFAGRVGSPGVGAGRVLVVRPAALVTAGRGPAGSPDEEAARLSAALETAAGQLETLARQLAERAGDETGAIFEAQALFARDPGIVQPAMDAIAAGAAAADAILSSTDDQAAVLAAVDDEYFRARAADVRDVGRRVVGILDGGPASDLWHPDGGPAILVADDLDPSAVATLRTEFVAGIALAGGAPTGHVSIVARGLGIPLVLGPRVRGDGRPRRRRGARGRSRPAGRLADRGSERRRPCLGPGSVTPGHDRPGATPAVGRRRRRHQRDREHRLDRRGRDGHPRAGAAGIGLVRTELLFLGRRTPPSVAEQRNLYGRIREVMTGRPVVFRTLDVGGDKPAAWQTDRPEANPALGVRGVRLGLARPGLLDDQLRALVGSAAGSELRVMLPMVSTVDEVLAVRARLDGILATVDEQPASVSLGVMIEVPAAAIVADGLAEVADFFSIGTNDLVQYTLAADRVNPSLAELATPLQPGVIRLIAGVVSAARARGRHVAVCGEAAADPEMIPLLAGLGVDELSVAPGSLAVVGRQVAGLRLTACEDLARRALAATTVEAVRTVVREATG